MLPSDASASADHVAGSPRIRFVGKPAFGIRVSIRDEDNKALARGEIGEVCVQGGHVMREYWNKREATEEALRSDEGAQEGSPRALLGGPRGKDRLSPTIATVGNRMDSDCGGARADRE